MTRVLRELQGVIDQLAADGVTVRGIYDVSGMRSDADISCSGCTPVPGDKLQAALRSLRRAVLLSPLLPTWNAMGVHREARVPRASHAPAFLRGKEPSAWMCVYPFVRSYEWYILPPEERRGMLAEHGRKGAAHRGAHANTVAAFGLGDYEWLLAVGGQRAAGHRGCHPRPACHERPAPHVREETPFFTLPPHSRRASPEVACPDRSRPRFPRPEERSALLASRIELHPAFAGSTTFPVPGVMR